MRIAEGKLVGWNVGDRAHHVEIMPDREGILTAATVAEGWQLAAFRYGTGSRLLVRVRPDTRKWRVSWATYVHAVDVFTIATVVEGNAIMAAPDHKLGVRAIVRDDAIER